MFLLFVRCSRVQTLGLRRYRGKIYFSDSTFLSMWAVSSFVWISLVLMLPEILLVISPSSFFISPRAPRTTGIVNFFFLILILIFQILLISFSRFVFLENFPVDFAETFLSDGTIASISMHLPSFLPLMTKSGLFACISLTV